MHPRLTALSKRFNFPRQLNINNNNSSSRASISISHTYSNIYHNATLRLSWSHPYPLSDASGHCNALSNWLSFPKKIKVSNQKIVLPRWTRPLSFSKKNFEPTRWTTRWSKERRKKDQKQKLQQKQISQPAL